MIWEVSADATEFFCLFKCRAVLLIQNFLFKKQALKVESGFICLMAIFLLIALIPICTVLVWCCSSNKSDDIMMQMHQTNGDDEMQTNPIISFEDTNNDSTFYCRRVLQFFLQFFSLFLMWVCNQINQCFESNSHINGLIQSHSNYLFPSQSFHYCHVHNEWIDSFNHFEYTEYRAIIAVRYRNI